MIKPNHTSRSSPNNADVNQSCSSWLEERDTAHPIRRKCWNFCHQSRPVPFEFDPIVLREPHPAQSCLPASVRTAAKAHGGSDSAECKGTRLCCLCGEPHSWWFNVCMLRPLARCVFRPSPHDNLAHFVQNTVGFFKVPAFRPANSVRQMSLEQFKQRHALPVQVFQVTYCHVPLPAQHIPFQSFDKYLCDLVAWVHDRRHIEQGGISVPGRGADLLVQVIYLVYTM